MNDEEIFTGYDKQILFCEKSRLDLLTYIWLVILPQFVIAYASFPGYLRGHVNLGLIALQFLPCGYIILSMAKDKFFFKRLVSAAIWVIVFVVIWFELPLWFYVIYLSVPMVWVINYKKRSLSRVTG